MSILAALADRVQFVVYNRATKSPVHPETLYPIDGQNPGNWLRVDVAQQWATFLGDGYGVGLVLWKGCGIACVDIDKALIDGQWSPLARELCARFAGAYQEVSQGRSGIHIFFSYTGAVPPHRKKNVPAHIEFYDELRFIGITELNAVGDVKFDATHLIPKLIADYFVPAPADLGIKEWTTEPVAEWEGPTDDAELVNRMIAMRSPGAAFGQRASFYELWTGDVHALSRAFPAQTDGKLYDASSADQALANHLAFYTGGNCERIAKLMRDSALVRPKWEREDYFARTIVKAVAGQKSFYKQRDTLPPSFVAEVTLPSAVEASGPYPLAPLPPPAALAPGGVPLPPNVAPAAMPPDTSLGAVVGSAGQLIMFKGCMWVQDVDQIMVPSGHTLKRASFDGDERFAGRNFITTRDGSGPTKSAWECFLQSQIVAFPKVRGTYFDPREPEGVVIIRDDGLPYVNTWRDPKIVATPGDPAPYIEHIRKILPKGDDALIYLSFVAGCVQNIGIKSAWSLFVQGVPGNGKSFLTKVLTYCLGEDYVHSASASNLDNRFNGYLYRKLLICVEEVMTTEGKAATWEKLKTMITETRQEIEQKGIDQITREVCFNMIFNSNHKDGIRKTAEDRRICPLFCAQQSVEDLERDGMDEAYFIRLWDWFNGGGNAVVLHFLRTFAIPDQYNFAKGARRAPRTTSTDEAIDAGLGGVEQDIQDAISAGTAGFRNGWISSIALGNLLATGKGKFIAKNKRRDMLSALGYMQHPGLVDGRLTVATADGNKPRLYIQRGHIAAGITDPLVIKTLYETAQRD